MQVTINSDNTATIIVNRHELGVIDYALGHFVENEVAPQEDIDLANSLEQQLWNEYCRLVDQIQEQGHAAQEAYDQLWA